jgi:cytochrome oxidase Cu insertion factor (SCO1/SenC/PrrC family)
MSQLRERHVEDGPEEAESAPQSPRGGAGGRRRGLLLAIGIGVLAGLLLGAVVAVPLWRHARATRDLALAAESCKPIQCSDLGQSPAPAFRLTDQHGSPVSLAGLRGRAIVLTFMDPRCTAMCPIVSQEFVSANKALGPASRRVAFVAINVNQNHESTAALRAFSKKHGLTSMSNWYFLTGSTAQLTAVWRDWGIEVIPNKTGDVIHTTVVYFIDPQGRTRFAAFPVKSKASIDLWGKTITQTVRTLQA